MSLDRSLKSRSALVRSRSVLTRAERIVLLQNEDRWTEEDSVFGLPKVRQRRRKAGSKSKAADTEQTAETDQAATEGAEPATSENS